MRRPAVEGGWAVKFTHPIAFPELLELPENGSSDWMAAAMAYAERCIKAETSTLFICPACGWTHETKKAVPLCLSCGGELTTVEFGEHERSAVLAALYRLKMRMDSGGPKMVLK